MEYPKTNHLWYKKGQGQTDEIKRLIRIANNGKIPFTDAYAEPDFGLVDLWDVEEKIDGTNIRIILKEHKRGQGSLSEKFRLTFAGRSKEATIPVHLHEYLMDTITIEKLLNAVSGTWMMLESTIPMNSDITFFGEGYGYKIQGDYYKIGTPQFALFDIVSAGRWASRDKVREIAHKIGIYSAPHIGTMDEQEIVSFVKSKPKSIINPEITMEGVIARGEAFSKGEAPLFKANKRFKLRCEDF